MLTTSDVDSDTEIARQRRGAARFFWTLLNIATSMSVAAMPLTLGRTRA
jgi:hypothetical protein